MPLTAHLVGSVPLDDPEAVFRRLASELGPHVTRLVDGETGHRRDWVGHVRRALGHNPNFEKDTASPPFQLKQWDGKVLLEWPLLKFKDGIDRAEATIETCYAADAITAFRIFERLQREGAIPPTMKYQACLAAPLNITYLYVTPSDQADFTRLYTAHLAGAVAEIAAAVPHDRLAVQWEVCQEVLMWDGYFTQPPGYKDDIVRSLQAVGEAVPDDVELGYHFCYGSPADEHIVQPADLGTIVEMANGVLAALHRPVQFLHIPVPKERSDESYVRPLDDLKLPPGTELFLGCVHPGDAEGNEAKLAAAQAHISVAGIASECGWGRGAPEKLGAILDAHRQLIAGGTSPAP